VAFAVRIIGFTDGGAELTFEMAPPWWPERELREDPRFRASISDGYLDYDADLSVEETRDLHERFKGRATQGVYAFASWQAIIQPMIGELDRILAAPVAHRPRFHMCVFEWESGLD
jgi:hypothetical protein